MHEVVAMHDVTRRARAFGFHAHVARRTSAGIPLFAVLVTAEAGGHRWAQAAVMLHDAVVAARAVTSGGGVVVAMREAQVHFGLRHGFARLVPAVAQRAFAAVMRLRMARAATARAGQIE